jgi:hypothetical protein
VKKFFARHQGGKPELSDCRMLNAAARAGCSRPKDALPALYPKAADDPRQFDLMGVCRPYEIAIAVIGEAEECADLIVCP